VNFRFKRSADRKQMWTAVKKSELVLSRLDLAAAMELSDARESRSQQYSEAS
jgi:hypothetical protein